MVPAVGKHGPTKAKRRRPAVAAVVAVAAATSLVAGADTNPSISDRTACCAELAPPAPKSPEAVAVKVPHVRHVLPVGVAPEKGLQVKTILAARAVSGMFPAILTIGGVRPDSMRWHPNGLAIDVMIPNYHTPEGKALGDRVVAFVLDNAERFGLNHVLWRQTSFRADRPPRPMSDRGSDTANHFDHVHIATNGGGYPTGHETYLS
jgi:hypothetical protein